MRGAWVDGELLYGRGVINDKAQLCAEMIAARAIKKADVRLKGDLTVAGVDFETGAPSVDDKQGIHFPGEGFGSKWLIDRGVVADYALVGETSEFGIITAECGSVWLKLTVGGRKVYTPRLRRGPTAQENPNPLERAAHVMVALEQWARRYEEEERYDFPGGTIIPKAQVVDVRSSGNCCYVYLDVRIAPGKNPLTILRQVQRVTAGSGIDCGVTVYQYSRGYATQNADPLVNALREAHRYVHGTEAENPPPEVVSMWRDSNAFNEAGIPAVCYGPRRQKEKLTSEGNRAMLISDLVVATKVYAIAAMSLCEIAEDT